jgi:hypothetical protein
MKTFLVFLSVLLPTTGCAAQIPISIRPVTIQVVDNETKKPLAGVPVFYVLRTMVIQKYVFFVIPNIEPEIGSKIVYKRRATTNNDGKVKFNSEKFKIPKNERFIGEEFFVNIDADMMTREAKIYKETLSTYYTGNTSRDGDVDNIDIVHEYTLMATRTERDKVLFNPLSSHGGAVIISMAYPQSRQEGMENDRYESGENLSLFWAGDTLDKNNDLIVVPLQQKPVPN